LDEGLGGIAGDGGDELGGAGGAGGPAEEESAVGAEADAGGAGEGGGVDGRGGAGIDVGGGAAGGGVGEGCVGGVGLGGGWGRAVVADGGGGVLVVRVARVVHVVDGAVFGNGEWFGGAVQREDQVRGGGQDEGDLDPQAGGGEVHAAVEGSPIEDAVVLGGGG